MASRIPPGSNRGNAQKFLVSGLRLGLTNASIYRQLVAGGLGYNHKLFTQDMARLRRGPLPRSAPIGTISQFTKFEGFPTFLIGRGKPRYKYNFEARTRDSRGRFNGGMIRWSFTSPQLLIPDVATGIGTAIAPDVGVERYQSLLPADTMPIYEGDIYGYTDPEFLAPE